MDPKNWVNFLSLVFSLLAIVVSYWSYRAARQSLEFEEEKSSFEARPALTESLDSVYVHFSSNNENSELQFLQINFPDSFSDRLITLNTRPLKVNKFELELLAMNYLKQKIALMIQHQWRGKWHCLF